MARVGPDGLLIGLDMDAENLPKARERLEAVGHPFHLHHSNFAGFPAANSDILISCQLGNVVQNFLCPHGCKSNGTAASCYP